MVCLWYVTIVKIITVVSNDADNYPLLQIL